MHWAVAPECYGGGAPGYCKQWMERKFHVRCQQNHTDFHPVPSRLPDKERIRSVRLRHLKRSFCRCAGLAAVRHSSTRSDIARGAESLIEFVPDVVASQERWGNAPQHIAGIHRGSRTGLSRSDHMRAWQRYAHLARIRLIAGLEPQKPGGQPSIGCRQSGFGTCSATSVQQARKRVLFPQPRLSVWLS